MATTQPIRCEEKTRQLAQYFRHVNQMRNYIMVTIAMHTGLRIGDILRLTWNDVYDFKLGQIRDHIIIKETKTKKSKLIKLGKKTTSALKQFAKRNVALGKFLIENPKTRRAISRIQAYRIIRKAAEHLKFTHRVSCHSLRKTFGYHAWKKGISPILIMKIFNHSSICITELYLGIIQDDLDFVYQNVELTT